MVVGVALTLLASSQAIVPEAGAQALAAQGRFSAVIDWPIIPIHAALTPTGQVVTYGTDGTGVWPRRLTFDVWDPAKGTHTSEGSTQPIDLFCSTLAESNGRLYTFGGQTVGTEDDGHGAVVSYLAGQGVRQEAEMTYRRWYPTANVLPDGDILVEGGSERGTGGGGVPVPERFDPASGWTTLDGARSSQAYGDFQQRWWYPRSWVDPRGNIFGLSGTQMYELDPDARGSISMIGQFDRPNVGATSTAVMYRPGKILQVGGGNFGTERLSDATNAATIIDVNGPTPVISEASPALRARHWANSTVLPDGTVLLSGGSPQNNWWDDVAMNPELWDPETDTWTTMAGHDKIRLYHSTALLLPDGRVMLGGGGARGPQTNLNVEFFEPPYLFDGDGDGDGDAAASRPQIESAPSEIRYGQSFPVSVSSDVRRFTLVRAGSVTHSFDSGQRFMELSATGSGGQRRVNAPANGALAPPGTYLLTGLDAAGTPSVSSLVSIKPQTSAPVVVEPKTPVTVKPKTPVTVAPKVPVTVKPKVPVTVKPKVPVTVKPKVPVTVKPKTPVTVKPKVPVVAGPKDPKALVRTTVAYTQSERSVLARAVAKWKNPKVRNAGQLQHAAPAAMSFLAGLGNKGVHPAKVPIMRAPKKVTTFHDGASRAMIAGLGTQFGGLNIRQTIKHSTLLIAWLIVTFG